ncbi:hypothetical protein [Actinopolymorpha rutila]|uniref:ARB-07466-like C-terminal domain-containing protein n=1 Tax=Actinopolymorpha rutila TaxID=446787 RepID=A0A852ZN24_9ACTN|nr:hypothetical protein [Actinopolymorpha rutila]NYH90869.1 hypothetical protein [Actinopolymorpha rutila]
MSESSNRRIRPTRRDLVSAVVLGAVAAPLTYAAAARHKQEDEVPVVDSEDLGLELVQWARTMPPTPSFPARIDAYAAYVGGTRCAPTAKPGVVDVRNLIFRTYGSRAWSIGHPCTGGVSEHAEGRALDVAFNAYSRTSRKAANDFFWWLLRPDSHGNRHAMARRLGIMYAIWDRKMWRAYRPNEGWLPYSGTPNPHTNHFHLSFSWAGALRRTTWWTLQ